MVLASMYIRFVSSHLHATANANLGMFTARDSMDFSDLKGSLQKAHEEAWIWFSPRGPGGLSFPRFTGKARTSNVRKSLYWFKEDASFWGYGKGSVIRRARELAKSVTDSGTEIKEIKSKNPGEIIWSDSDQILALPGSGQSFYAFPQNKTPLS